MFRLTPWTVAADGLVAKQGARHSAQVLGRFAVREHGPAFWATLWVAGAAAVLAAIVPVIRERGAPGTTIDVVFILAAGAFAGCGLIAWRRRPDNHSGRLMTVAGFGALAYPLLSQLDSPLSMTVAILFGSAWTIAYVALLLTFVTGGRLESAVDRLLVGVFALTLLVLQFAWMLFLELEDNLLLVHGDAQIAEAIDVGRLWLTAAASLAVVIVLAARWRAASRPRRRALLPGVVGGLSAVLYAALLVNGLLADAPSQPLWVLTNGALLLVPAAYLAGLLRSRLARGGLADLILDVKRMRGEELQAALGRALGDPGLVVAGAGAAPAAGGGRSVAPIELGGREVAALVYDASLDDDPELVEAVRAAAAIALENEHLHEESRARLAELRASRERLVAAGDEERRRLERNLHDGAQQRLVALALQLRLIQGSIRGGDASAAERLVSSASDELALSLDELRELARGIHPAVLDHGLEAALDSLAGRCTVPTAVSYEAPARLSEAVELAAFFVASEALANVGKYARATAASVRVSSDGDVAVIEVADDGVGGASARSGSGLSGLADRVEALDGRLRVTSPPGAGTVVTAELPLRAASRTHLPGGVG